MAARSRRRPGVTLLLPSRHAGDIEMPAGADRRAVGSGCAGEERPPPDEVLAALVASLRTTAGARQFCAIRSYLSTAAKHGIGFFGALIMLAEGKPWMPAAARSTPP